MDPRILLVVIALGTIYYLLESSVDKLIILFFLIFLLVIIRNQSILKYVVAICLFSGAFLGLMFMFGKLLFFIFKLPIYFNVNDLIIMYLRIINITILYFLFYIEITPENLTKALIFFKIPYHNAWTISTAYRYIFLLINESKELRNTLIIRGVPIDGKLIEKLRSLPLLMNLLVFRTNFLAIKFSEALFAKSWSPYGKKSFYRPLVIKSKINGLVIMYLFVFIFSLITLHKPWL